MSTLVSQVPAADSASAVRHFSAAFGFETDCWDVHDALATAPDFVLLDVRSPDAFARGHVPGAINLPHRKIIAARMAHYPANTLFVAYCTGPHCNGAHRGALRLAQLGRPVKLMLGGWAGWLAERFAVARDPAAAISEGADA
jgi:rhodanese-related sulfurtransferase